MNSENKIVLYVVPGCPLCAEAKGWLDGHGITYSVEDVANDYSALRRMYKLTRQRLVPVLRIGDRAVVRPAEKEAIDFCSKN